MTRCLDCKKFVHGLCTGVPDLDPDYGHCDDFEEYSD